MIESEATSQKTYLAPELKIGWGYYIATTTPTADDDATQGFGYGSHWYKQSVPYRLWICTDNSDGAAIWREIPLADFRNMRSIFDSLTPVTTTGTATEVLQTGTVPAYTFFNDGDEVRITYRGFFAANANQKHLLLDMDVSNHFDTGALTKNGGSWILEQHITRVASDELSLFAKYEDELMTLTNVTNTSGLDLTLAIDFVLKGITPDLAGDVTLQTAKAWFMPAAPDNFSNVLYLGDNVTYSGEQVIY